MNRLLYNYFIPFIYNLINPGKASIYPGPMYSNNLIDQGKSSIDPIKFSQLIRERPIDGSSSSSASSSSNRSSTRIDNDKIAAHWNFGRCTEIIKGLSKTKFRIKA